MKMLFEETHLYEIEAHEKRTIERIQHFFIDNLKVYQETKN